MARLCGRAREELNQLFFQEDANAIRWADVSLVGKGEKKEPRVTLHLTPISIADVLTRLPVEQRTPATCARAA